MKRKRWTIGKLAGLLWTCVATGAVGSSGCKQQLYMEPADHRTALDSGLMARLETSPHEAVVPQIAATGRPPATVEDMDRPVRNLSLKEAIAIGMEQGNVGGQPTNPGFMQDILPQFSGAASGTDSIRAFAIAPAVAAAQVERSLSKFDARFISSLTWNQTDNPTLTLQQSFSNGDSATFSQTLAKPLPTGGVAGITFSTQYLKLAQPPTNPQFVALAASYTPRLQFVFEQPLLQNFGIEANQLNANHPGSLLIPGFRTTGQGTEGILLTRVRVDQQRAEFDRQVNTHLLNIEGAYWNLYSAYYNLAAREEGLKQALDGYLFFSKREQGGVARPSIVYQNAAQYFAFRTQVTQARQQVFESERQLRGLLGMRSDDGTRLVPIDEPNIAPYTPDWDAAFQEMRALRPELSIIRQEVKARQLEYQNQVNQRRPDLRLISAYDVAGLGPRLDGATNDVNAFRSLASNQFNTWQVGLRFEMPIGFRDANGLVRQALLNMKTTVIQMQDAERKAEELLAAAYRNVETTHKLIVDNRNQRVQLQNQIKLELNLREQGQFDQNAVVSLLQAQQSLANVIAQEFTAIANYNIALASLELAKGTIQRYNNVTVSEGALPDFVQKKAADHFAERDHAIKLREHPANMPMPQLHLPAWQSESKQLLQSLDTIMADPQATPAAPAPAPAAPRETAPPAAPQQPMAQPPVPLGSAPQVRPQLVPGDAPSLGNGTFQPTGTVVLPTRPRPVSTEPPQ